MFFDMELNTPHWCCRSAALLVVEIAVRGWVGTGRYQVRSVAGKLCSSNGAAVLANNLGSRCEDKH